MQRIILYISLLTSILLFSIPGHAEQEAGFVLIVNKDNPINEISYLDAKRIFLGKKAHWSDNRTIVLVVNKTDEIHRQFTRKIVKKNPTQFSTYWKKQLFSGHGTLPRSCKTDEEVKKMIALDRNAIGYISSHALDASIKKIVLN